MMKKLFLNIINYEMSKLYIRYYNFLERPKLGNKSL